MGTLEKFNIQDLTLGMGQQYFVGYLGAAKVLVLKDKHAAEGQPGWALMVAPRPEKRDQAGRQDRAGAWSGQIRIAVSK